jgi:teichuronic acid biosynthesis glycosyltransferase TuaG
MESPPLVSILMPAYNAWPFIQDAIHSVLAQTYKNWELIIVDDCSSDRTGGFVRDEFKEEKRIRVFSLPVNSGPGSARDVALQKAEGEWVTVLDSDDAYSPNRLLRLLELAEKNDADCLADNHFIVNSASEKSKARRFPLHTINFP